MPTFFLSHATLDAPLALAIKALLEASVAGVTIFCSSDATDLPPGTLWTREIERVLQESQSLFVLATGRSLARPWVWFECGTFWFSRKPVVPLCIGQIRKGVLPAPLSERQGLNLDEAADVDQLLAMLERASGVNRTPTHIDAIVARLRALDQEADQASRRDAGWLGAIWQDRFLAYDGPLEGLNLIEDRPFEQSMADVLTAQGFRPRLGEANRLAQHADLGSRIVFLTDRARWRQRLVRGTAVLIARPEPRN